MQTLAYKPFHQTMSTCLRMPYSLLKVSTRTLPTAIYEGKCVPLWPTPLAAPGSVQ